jgi:hypothetical protein
MMKSWIFLIVTFFLIVLSNSAYAQLILKQVDVPDPCDRTCAMTCQFSGDLEKVTDLVAVVYFSEQSGRNKRLGGTSNTFEYKLIKVDPASEKASFRLTFDVSLDRMINCRIKYKSDGQEKLTNEVRSNWFLGKGKDR